MLSEPDFVHRLLDQILQYELGIVEHACSLDIDVMRFGDDWGHQQGLIMGIELWREYVKPRIEHLYRAVKSRGKYVMIHCCGKVAELFPELIACGLDIFNPFQPEVMDIFEMKKCHGDDLTFYGGISLQRTLPHGTVDQVKDEVRRCIDELGENGGYIAAPAHDLPADAKPENVAAMIEMLQNQ
jgi:uroporphyrinogen decarboxylase